tara:strand:- start:91 stop:954 length:864 start_codon:yes stop_codon:yes gene_type:complete
LKILEILNNIDRRIIYLLLSIVVIVPLILKSEIEISPGPYAESTFNAIQNEFGTSSTPKSNKKILISFDYGPSTSTEVNPMAFAIMKQVLLTGNEVYTMALFDTGIAVSEQINKKLIEDLDLLEKYETQITISENIIELGYASGGEAAIKNMLENIDKVFPNAPPHIENLCDYDFVVSLSSGTPGSKEWVMYAGDHAIAECGKELKITTGVTAVQAPESIPYVSTGQLKGMLAGLSGAASYEKLMNYSGSASEKMPSQSWAHLLIIILIIIGNITYFIMNRKDIKND